MPYGRSKFGSRRRMYGRRRSRVPSRVPKASALRAAHAIAASNRTSVRMCKDLGVLWPNCVVVKLKDHFFAYCGTNGAATAYAPVPTSKYQGCITGYPYAPYVNFGDTFGNPRTMNTDSQGSLLGNRQPLGWGRLIGDASSAAGATGALYGKCCCLRVDYNLKYYLMSNIETAKGTTPWNARTGIAAYTRDYDFTETNMGDISSMVTFSQNIIQPNVRVHRKITHGHAKQANFNATAAAASLSDLDCTTVHIKGTLWPHRALEQSWATYVSSDTSFGLYNANPTDYARVEIGIKAHQLSLAQDSDTLNGHLFKPYVQAFVTYTCLFKDPRPGITS